MHVNFTGMATRFTLANDQKPNKTAAELPTTDFNALVEQNKTVNKAKETAIANRQNAAVSSIFEPLLVKQQASLTHKEPTATLPESSVMPFVQGNISAIALQQSQFNGDIAKRKASSSENPDTKPSKWTTPPDLGKYSF